MTATRRVARPLLASIFIAGGVDAAKNPEGKAEAADKVASPLASTLGLPDDTTTLVRANGIVQIVAGGLLALGRMPRLAAMALMASLVPTTLAGHRFWEEDDPQARAGQRIHFLKNAAVIGGLILAATDTEGRPSLSWRAKRAAAKGRKAAKKGRKALPLVD
jgi:putative oxidoreductase